MRDISSLWITDFFHEIAHRATRHIVLITVLLSAVTVVLFAVPVINYWAALLPVYIGLLTLAVFYALLDKERRIHRRNYYKAKQEASQVKRELDRVSQVAKDQYTAREVVTNQFLWMGRVLGSLHVNTTWDDRRQTTLVFNYLQRAYLSRIVPSDILRPQFILGQVLSTGGLTIAALIQFSGFIAGRDHQPHNCSKTAQAWQEAICEAQVILICAGKTKGLGDMSPEEAAVTIQRLQNTLAVERPPGLTEEQFRQRLDRLAERYPTIEVLVTGDEVTPAGERLLLKS